MSKLPVYVVLDGGGIKGVALAGALEGLQRYDKFDVRGFGGTSAGAIVAMLAVAGYSGQEIGDFFTKELSPKSLLDDDGVMLANARAMTDRGLSGLLLSPMLARNCYSRLNDPNQLGLYSGKKIQRFLAEKLLEKTRGAGLTRPGSEITFQDLISLGWPRLRVVATDVTGGYSRTYGNDENLGTSVVSAVRASMAFPLVFTPVSDGTYSRLLDGGLTSNLPAHIFDDLRAKENVPLIAMDLETRPAPERSPPASFGDLVRALLNSALDGSQGLAQTGWANVIRVPVVLDAVDAMNFSIGQDKLLLMREQGKSQAYEFLDRKFRSSLNVATNTVQQLQSMHGRPEHYAMVLWGVAQYFSTTHSGPNWPNVRSNVMLPTGRGTRAVIYQYGMSHDADLDLELEIAAGCSGRAFTTGDAAYADMKLARQTYDREWSLTQAQQNRIPANISLMLSVPVWGETGPIGTLSIDTDAEIPHTGWVRQVDAGLEIDREVLRRLNVWAAVLGRMLRSGPDPESVPR